MRRGPRLPLEALAPVMLEMPGPAARAGLATVPPDLLPQQPIHWPQLFGNDNPVEVEVGFGKGLFLVNASHSRPQTNFLGVEIERKYALFTATRLIKRGLTNVKVACCDAHWFFSRHVADASLKAVHVFFPDPWWKNRHRERRLFTAAFAAQCHRAVATGGFLHLVTDVESYFAGCVEILAQCGSFELLPPPEPHQPAHDMDYLTNFERKYRQEGRAIYRGLWIRGEGREVRGEG
jgi:tRNA (guanine-N7-)-methyltransferase